MILEKPSSLSNRANRNSILSMQHYIRKSYSAFNISLILILSISIFASSPQIENSIEKYSLVPILVPHFSLSSLVRNFLISLLCIGSFTTALIFNKSHFKFDYFLAFLTCRILLAAIQLIVIGNTDETIRLGNYYLYIIELIIYCHCVSFFNSFSENRFFNIIRFFVLIVAIETIYQSIIGVLPYVDYTSLWYKANLNLPIGSSNILSAIILPILISEIYFLHKNTSTKSILFIAICIVAIFTTKSRWSIIILLALYLKFFSFFKKRKILLFLNSAIVFGGLLYLIQNIDIISTISSGYAESYDTEYNVDSITSGRLTLLKYFFSSFLSNPIIGNGPNYIYSRAHNLFVDILYQNGLIGLVFFCIGIIQSISRYRFFKKRNKESHNLDYSYTIVWVSLLVSMGEISIFTNITCDYIFLPCLAILNTSTNRIANN